MIQYSYLDYCATILDGEVSFEQKMLVMKIIDVLFKPRYLPLSNCSFYRESEPAVLEKNQKKKLINMV